MHGLVGGGGVYLLNHIRLFATPRIVAHQAPLSMEFSWQEYWSSLPLPPSGDLPNPGIKPGLLHWQVVFFAPEPPGKPVLERSLFI